MACGLGLDIWQVIWVWAMPHKEHDYLVHSLSEELCPLMGTGWALTVSYGHLARVLCLASWNIGWALAMSHYGYRLGMADGI